MLYINVKCFYVPNFHHAHSTCTTKGFLCYFVKGITGHICSLLQITLTMVTYHSAVGIFIHLSSMTKCCCSDCRNDFAFLWKYAYELLMICNIILTCAPDYFLAHLATNNSLWRNLHVIMCHLGTCGVTEECLHYTVYMYIWLRPHTIIKSYTQVNILSCSLDVDLCMFYQQLLVLHKLKHV